MSWGEYVDPTPNYRPAIACCGNCGFRNNRDCYGARDEDWESQSEEQRDSFNPTRIRLDRVCDNYDYDYSEET